MEREVSMTNKEEIKMIEAEIKNLQLRENFLKGAACCKPVSDALNSLCEKLKTLKSKKENGKKENTDSSD